MPTELNSHINYEQRSRALKQLKTHEKRIRGVVFPDEEAFPFLQKPERTQRIKTLASACGCQFAAKIAVGVTVAYLVLTGIGILKLSSSPLKNYLIAIPVFVIAAVVGKLVAIHRIRTELRAVSSEMQIEVMANLLRSSSERSPRS